MIRIMLLGTGLQGSVTVLSVSMGMLRRYFAMGGLDVATALKFQCLIYG